MPGRAAVLRPIPDDLHERLRARVAAALPPLHGWTSVEKGTRMAELVVAARSRVSVELGVFGGRGTIALALGHQALRDGYVIAVDPWSREASLEGENAADNDAWWAALDHDAIYASFLAALDATGTADRVRVWRERSAEAAERVDDGSVDLLHQDSNHSEAVSSAEVELWTPKLRPGGLWIADDTDWPTTQRAQARLVELGFAPIEDHGAWKVYRR